MTGIIQKTIRKWQYINSKTTIGQFEIHQLRQELITKIDDVSNDLMLSPIQRHILIGDGKE